MDIGGVPKTWQDAFENNPIASVRAIEKQLRAAAARDREKLRGLVGGNYRDLLSTAEEIVQLDVRTRAVESQISDLGQRCRPPQHARSLHEPSPQAITAAQVQLLNSCIMCSKTALRSKSVLLSAELTVVTNLLLITLGERDTGSVDINGIRVQAAAHRRQLLRHIDAQLIHPASSLKSMIDAICAYCLITSASSGDATKHFQQLRLNKLRQRATADAITHGQVCETLQYLLVSIQTLKALLGRGVNEVLGSLQRQPILSSPDVTRLETLGIDQLRTLIPKDVLTFTPYIKRVQQSKGDITEAVQSWSLQASQSFSESLNRTLLETKLVSDVLSLRKDLLSSLLPVYFSTDAQDVVLRGVRESTSARILQLCTTQTETLLSIGKTLVSIDTDSASSTSLWDNTFIHKHHGSETVPYLQQVKSRHLGTKGGLDKILKKLRKWSQAIKQIQEQLQATRTIRWQDIIEEAEEEDEEAADTIISSLAKDDPEYFGKTVRSTLHNTITNFDKVLHDAVLATLSASRRSPSRIVFLLRALRESSVVVNNAVPDHQSQTRTIYVQLYDALAEIIVISIADKFEGKSTAKKIKSLPEDLPSSLTFAVLHAICTTMSDIGGVDVWSTAAIAALKRQLRARMLYSDSKSAYTHSDFDEYYLRAALSDSVDDGATTSGEKNGGAAAEKAGSYWNRTRLLFGVLGQLP